MTGVGEDMEELGPSYTAGGNVKLCSHCGKPLTVTQKVEQPWCIVMTRSWNFVMTSNLEHCDDQGHGAL